MKEVVPRKCSHRKPMEAPYVSPSLLTDGDTLFSTISTGIKFDKYDVIPVDVSDPQFRMSTNFNEMSLSGKMAAFVLLILDALLSDTVNENASYQPVQSAMVVVLWPTDELAIQVAQRADMYA
ncbi:hypothetical protein HPB51_007086 [Rhipicephalus microplus]|uniref:Uncharacterized protein n=1 Tax=Rhipicephalus microplus TaxID=6941 RepID=A0A9J6E0K4_RHIMP|nr:hypothetical protein HPB51_007086 [Rhipicephalus microplus]